MKKILPMLLLFSLLVGCAGLPDISQFIFTPTPLPVDTSTPQPTVTPFPTYTATKDLFAISTSTPVTFTPTDTPVGLDVIEDEVFTPPPTFSIQLYGPNGLPLPPKTEGFVKIITSGNVIYWNSGPCTPRNVKFDVVVEDSANTSRVLLFMRLREKKNTLNITDWNSGAIMLNNKNGSFSYNVRTFNINRYYYFSDAWLEYQLVSVTNDLKVIARTPIYDRMISLIKCQPVP